MSHTKGPWRNQEGFNTIYALSDGDAGLTIAIAKLLDDQVNGGIQEANENARRIVACVNACEGSDTEVLESLGLDFIKPMVDLIDRNRQLEQQLAARDAEIAELRKDAERYQWLRNSAHQLTNSPKVYGQVAHETDLLLFGSVLDRQVDAAIARQGEKHD